MARTAKPPPRPFRLPKEQWKLVRTRALGPLIGILLSACAATPNTPGEPVLIQDSNTGCEGDGPHLEYRWERKDGWYVKGDRKVPADVVTRLRELAQTAPTLDKAPMPPALRFSEETIMERSGDIEEAACKWRPWLQDWAAPEPTVDEIAKVARERLIDPANDTDWSSLNINLPGTPPIRITTESQHPYAQPWQVAIGDAEPRKVLSIEISRYAMLLVDPAGPNYRHLEGAMYWTNGFWQDDDLWSRVYGDKWNKSYARELCTEIEGWEDVEKNWRLEDADIGNINMQPLSLQTDLVAKQETLIEFVRWWNRIDDGEPRYDWDTFVDVHARATKAAKGLPFLKRWKDAGKNRTITLDAVGRVGHNETQASFFHAPVWAHSELNGDPGWELLLRIDRKWAATILFSDEPDGAIVLKGDKSLLGTDVKGFHPTDGDYAVIGPDGAVEKRKMPPVESR
jgi:hypothetical protein